MKNNIKDKAIEACRILNHFVGDLIAGTKTLELYQSPKISEVANQQTQLFVRRMCISHLIITMSKWSEFYKRYKSIIPDNIKEKAKDLQRDIHARDLVNFRNTVVGHIWDTKSLKRALTPKEIDIRLQKVFVTNLKDFLNWIHNSKNQTNTVVGICELLRNNIQEEYKLTEGDIFN